MAEQTVYLGLDMTPELSQALDRLGRVHEEVRHQALLLAADVVRQRLRDCPEALQADLSVLASRAVRSFLVGAAVVVSSGDEPGDPAL